jgi:hypothetical protein
MRASLFYCRSRAPKALLASTANGLVIILLGMLAGGCADVGQSLRLTTSILVKVPLDRPVTPQVASTKGWKFYPILEAPKTFDRAGEWYLVWNPQRPINRPPLTPYWHVLFERAPEIADATFQVFGTYPTLIEPNETFVNVIGPKQGKPPTTLSHSAKSSNLPEVAKLTVNAKRHAPSTVWPDGAKPDLQHPGQFIIDPRWYADDLHSQLDIAREQLRRQLGDLVGEYELRILIMDLMQAIAEYRKT